MARRALSNDPGPVLLGALVSEKKIVKEKCFSPLFPLNRYNRARIGAIWTRKIWAYRARRALSNEPGSVLLAAIASEKKILGSYWSNLDEKNMGVEGAASPFQ
ncbi:hypothetical protein V1477_004503 [Vespula maculifrons]|uniref:Uncharacterized protein n=1 Tax=Vespula maculifrons TaxID=7453 RepID=A0ABD2CPS0_VESMC